MGTTMKPRVSSPWEVGKQTSGLACDNHVNNIQQTTVTTFSKGTSGPGYYSDSDKPNTIATVLAENFAMHHVHTTKFCLKKSILVVRHDRM